MAIRSLSLKKLGISLVVFMQSYRQCQILRARAYFANVGIRLVKTPKVYFTDVGTLWLFGRPKRP